MRVAVGHCPRDRVPDSTPYRSYASRPNGRACASDHRSTGCPCASYLRRTGRACASDHRSTGRPCASYLRRTGRACASDHRRTGRPCASDLRRTGRACASDHRSTGTKSKTYLYSNRKCHDLQMNGHRKVARLRPPQSTYIQGGPKHEGATARSCNNCLSV
jgi:hypothetical protein